jgi:pimeloyl-ACP methyl ester carboxylesterase
VLLAPILAAAAAPAPTNPVRPECVLVLHGLARGARSMTPLAARLTAAGFTVHNLAYPSTSEPFPQLVSRLQHEVDARSEACSTVHFVTYSLGGLVVRDYLARTPPPRLGRVVMIAPPNGGSEIVDALGRMRTFRRLLGPVAPELGTSAESLPNTLGPPRYPLGVIAGDRAINPFGWLLLPDPHDGTVSVASTRLDGMDDFLVVHRSHTFIMRAPEVAEQTITFLRTGRFASHDAS